MNGEDPQERPDFIRAIINGLERYNPEAAGTLEAYLTQQCEEKFCDCNANRALLKLYVGTLHNYLTSTLPSKETWMMCNLSMYYLIVEQSPRMMSK